SELSETELIGVCDVDSERAKNIAQEYDVEWYTDSTELLKHEEIEAVSICTWTTTHATEATRALKQGKHLFVEKPIASTVSQAREILDLAHREDRHLAVGFIERFNPGVRRVKDAIDQNRIGSVVS
ncbi:Gfo/Idh/MocA family oxidoreductase, partial [Candidatus Bathyarchaeota archaeon]|nr:Gfo/Idh/MocA family oxidoreductase [Candidatus Bathyarchaeota archaeon]NIR14542.1 Gfo/Idh/MocA family oxidoreductase [Desulfobacterales bacterium]NIU81195.1 Gfo/Idh/MocA family oxidoreductase [Candidatus Bathyarchaeota archaeon]NIV68322.1 Gfo/Idh/MocA family oxidoreductase [Candidatus Bathyarchaeota archaeon]